MKSSAAKLSTPEAYTGETEASIEQGDYNYHVNTHKSHVEIAHLSDLHQLSSSDFLWPSIAATTTPATVEIPDSVRFGGADKSGDTIYDIGVYNERRYSDPSNTDFTDQVGTVYSAVDTAQTGVMFRQMGSAQVLSAITTAHHPTSTIDASHMTLLLQDMGSTNGRMGNTHETQLLRDMDSFNGKMNDTYEDCFTQDDLTWPNPLNNAQAQLLCTSNMIPPTRDDTTWPNPLKDAHAQLECSLHYALQRQSTHGLDSFVQTQLGGTIDVDVTTRDNDSTWSSLYDAIQRQTTHELDYIIREQLVESPTQDNPNWSLFDIVQPKAPHEIDIAQTRPIEEISTTQMNVAVRESYTWRDQQANASQEVNIEQAQFRDKIQATHMSPLTPNEPAWSLFDVLPDLRFPSIEDKNVPQSVASTPPRVSKRMTNDSASTSTSSSRIGNTLYDGFSWRKTSKKILKDPLRIRYYYKCVDKNCNAKKQVEHSLDYTRIVNIIQDGNHNHEPPRTITHGRVLSQTN